MNQETLTTECALRIALLFNTLTQRERVAAIAFEAFEKAQQNAEATSAEFGEAFDEFLNQYGSEEMEKFFTEDEIMKMRRVLNV